MRRRAVLAGLATAWPLATRAQQNLPLVGFLSGRSAAETASVLAAFHRGLGEIGFAEGKNVAVITAGPRVATNACGRSQPSSS